MYTKSFRAMGTDVEIAVQSTSANEHADVEGAVTTAVQRMADLERRLSRFDDASDVSIINLRSGQWTTVHPDTAEVLRTAARAFAATRGLFNPCLGSALETLGYNVTFEHVKDSEKPSVRLTPVMSRECPYEVTEDGQVRVLNGLKVDVGGIAKGWIVEQSAECLRQYGLSNFVVNAGGDMVCAGKNGDHPWTVGIEEPFCPGTYRLTLAVESLAVATSSTSRRRWMLGDMAVHHIIDPRSGMSSSSDVVSCTVVHTSLVAAEVMAKVGLILGSRDGVAWLSQHSPRGWVVITETGEAIHSWNS